MNQYLWAAETILQRVRRPIGARELVDRAFAEGLLSDKLHGETPHKTMHARLAVEIMRHGDSSRFIRTAPGVYFLRALLGEVVADMEAPGMLSGETDRTLQLDVYAAPRRQPPATNERVLAIPRDAFAKIIRFQGFKRDAEGHLFRRLLGVAGASYLDRSSVEEDPRYKQVVTYVVVVRREAVLAFRRGSYSRAATFLRGNRCVGFGGHVTDGDLSLFSTADRGVSACAWRELHEEVSLGEGTPPPDTSGRFKYLGIINDDSSSVGQRHVAIVYEYNVDGDSKWDSVKRGEAAVNQLGWIKLGANPGAVDLNEFEYWSQLCWHALFPSFVRGQPRFKVITPRSLAGPHLLAVVGSIGSGKSVATQILVEQFGYGVVGSGQVLAQLLSVPPIPQSSREEFQERAMSFISQPEGPQKLAQALVSAANAIGQAGVVIDGIRQRATLLQLKAIAGLADGVQPARSVTTLFVHAAPDVAYRFYKRREPKGLSTAEFMHLYSAPVEAEIPLLISEADAILYNWHGKPAFDRAIRDLMKALQRGDSEYAE